LLLHACDGPVESTAISIMLGKPATSVTLLMVKEITGNKNGNNAATDRLHSFRVGSIIGLVLAAFHSAKNVEEPAAKVPIHKYAHKLKSR
jgi:hypothetical protein